MNMAEPDARTVGSRPPKFVISWCLSNEPRVSKWSGVLVRKPLPDGRGSLISRCGWSEVDLYPCEQTGLVEFRRNTAHFHHRTHILVPGHQTDIGHDPKLSLG